MPNASAPRAAACASLLHLHFQTASAKHRRPAQRHPARTEPTQNQLSTPVQNEAGAVHRTAPGRTLYGELKPIVNETDLIFVPKPENHLTPLLAVPNLVSLINNLLTIWNPPAHAGSDPRWERRDDFA